MKSNSMLVEIQRWQQAGLKPISIDTKDPEITSHRKTFLPLQRTYLASDKNTYFTTREMQIAELMMNDHQSYKAIAKVLDISPRTVEYYIQSMRNKLQVPNKIILRKKLVALREQGEL